MSAGFNVSAIAAAAASGANRRRVVSTPVLSEPHPLYPLFDLRLLPFHTASGDWGPQRAFPTSTPPNVTGGLVDVDTWAAYKSNWKLGNRVIRVNASISSGGDTIDGSCADVDCILMPGVVVKAGNFGQFGNGHTFSRCRLRGPTLGQHSGGQLHYTRWFGPPLDFHMDGIDITGPATHASDGQQRYALSMSVAGERVSITNCRGAAGSYFYIGQNSDFFIGGSSIISGLSPRAASGNEGWNIRQVGGLGAIVFSGCDLRTKRYNVIRMHPTGDATQAFIHDTWLVNINEGGLLTVNQSMVTSPKGNLRCLWVEGGKAWSFVDLQPGDINITGHGSSSAAYVRMRNFEVYSTVIASEAQLVINDVSDAEPAGNTPIPAELRNWVKGPGIVFNAYSAPTEWKSTTPGNPTGLNWDIGLT